MPPLQEKTLFCRRSQPRSRRSCSEDTVADGIPLIRLDAVSKIYRMGEVDVPALRGVSLDVEAGELVAIMGASGSGKSTMMNLLGCLDRPTTGRVLLDGSDVSGLDREGLADIRGSLLG